MDFFKSTTPETRNSVMHFHERMLKYSPNAPNSDFPEFCNIWRDAMDASWVWMWMYNDFSSQWELTAYDSNFDAEKWLDKTNLVWPDTTSVSEFVTQTEDPIFVNDLDHWHTLYKGTKFRVSCAKQLKQMGCTAFCTVPLISPISGETSRDPFDPNLPIRAAICAHYKDVKSWKSFPKESLILMGRLTGTLVRNSYNAEHRDILIHLNVTVHQNHCRRRV
ncbi:hypothetical protein Pan153_32260 [Gimesia panareensis]|uniref:Uncharacterized protein n=1 Tax=Gimesia panareensis TaxID=2527978 RepID=A0A518FQD9_9PLAN|nr:hypothetical protein [Gimesia panareensis]QDV18567.1 hypothetical protein Pan153_32260 [Gimesia panareensis]